MARFARYAQFEGLYFEVFHKGLHAFRNSSEVVVVHLLVLGRVVSHQRSPSEHQVGTGKIEALVYQEVFLFPTQVAANFLHFGVEILCHGRCCGVNGLQRTQ